MDSTLTSVSNKHAPTSVILSADGFRFELAKGDPSLSREGWFEAIASLNLCEDIHGRLVGVSCASYSPVQDLLDLCIYIENYIEAARCVKEDSVVQPGMFVPLSLAFRIELVDIEIYDSNKGDMTVVVQVNVGEGDHRIYVGVESSVNVELIKEFAISLRDFALAQKV